MHPLSQSKRRLQADIHRLLSQLMQTEINDPRLIGISITRVESSSSGHGMLIWVHHIKADPADSERRLNRLAPHFMYLLRHALPRQRLPDLHFRWDDAMDRGGKIVLLLDTFKRSDEA